MEANEVRPSTKRPWATVARGAGKKPTCGNTGWVARRDWAKERGAFIGVIGRTLARFFDAPGRPIAAHLRGLVAVGERTPLGAAREAADWFDGADAAAHECGDEAETQKGEEAGECRALPGETGDGDFADASRGQGAALGVGRSGRGVSDRTTAAPACVLQEMRRGGRGSRWLVGSKKMTA